MSVDLDVTIDRLLWLESQGLAIVRDARRLRHRAPRVALVDQDALVEEIARLSLVTQSRRDEVRIWRSLSRPPRRGRIVEPVRVGWWARVWLWLTTARPARP